MLDFLRIFEEAPTPFAVFDTDEFRILAANNAFLDGVGRARDKVVGKRVQDAFPRDPTDHMSEDHVRALKDSLNRVVMTGRVDEIPVQRYPIRRGETGNDHFEERFWNITNSPVHDEEGGILCIVHRLEDVTDLVHARRQRGEAYEHRRVFAVRADKMELEAARSQAETQRLNEHLKAAQQVGGIGSWEWSVRDGTRQWSDEMYRLTGVQPGSKPQTADWIRAVVHADDAEEVGQNRAQLVAGKGLPANLQYRIIRADSGEVRHVRERVDGRFDEKGKLVRLYGTIQDVTESHEVEKRLRTRARQQSVVADLGQMALIETDLLKVYESAVERIAKTLDVEMCKVLELLPDQQLVKLVAGVGWREGLVGQATVGIGWESQAGYTLKSEEPVVVEDLRTDTRFNGPALLRSHNVISGLSVIIYGKHGPWGILGAHTKRKRRFDNDDVNFVRSVANIIGQAIRRAAAEELVHSSQQRTRKIIDNSLDAVVAIDSQSQIIEWNPQAEVIFGWSRNEALGKSLHELIIPEAYRDAHLAGMKKYTETGAGPLLNRRIEVSALRKSGKEFPVELSIAPLPTDGSTTFSAFLRDITERKRSEAKILESEERFRMVAKATTDTVWDWNLLTDQVWWNDGLSKVFGYSMRDVESKPPGLLAFVHDDERAATEELIRKCISSKKEEWFTQCRFKRANDAYADVVLSGYIVRDPDGAATRIVGGVNDITESKEKEEKLAQQAALLDKAQDAIIVRDMDHRIQFWNLGAQRIYGWRFDEVQGKRIDELLHEDQELFEDAVNLLKTVGEWTGEIRQRRKDGTAVVCDVSWTLVTDAYGQPESVMSINTDVTARRALEDQLRQSQRLEAVGQLTGGVAHDFNNILTVILGNAEIMADQLASDKRLQRLAEMTRDAAVRGAKLTHGLLAFSRRQALEPKAVDANRLVRDLQSLLKRAVPESVEIEFRHEDGLSAAFVDPVQLESVLLNLVINARDAMSGSGRLTIETSNAYLDEDYAASNAEVNAGKYVMLAVSDTGSGIPPELIDRVFDPFFSTKEEGKGSGLGLSTAYGFMKQSGGHIKVYSEVGQGTTVRLYLPSATELEDSTETEVTVEPGQGEKILLVEDDELVRAYAETQLEALGYHVTSASGGKEALEILRSESDIELLFTDVIMAGGMNGPELVKLAKEFRPELKVLYTSGYTENAIVHHGRLDKGVHLLQKPYRQHDLARKMRRVLSGSEVE